MLPIACPKPADFYIWYFNLSSEEIWVEVHGFSSMASPGRLTPSRDTGLLSSTEISYAYNPPTIDDVITISWSKTEGGPAKEVQFKRSEYGIPRKAWYGKLTVIFTAAEKWELKYTVEEKNSKQVSE